MSFDPGQVVLVRFPFTNQQSSKQRPAVVLSTRAYADTRSDVVIAAVTSVLRPAASLGDATLVDWRAAGLLKPSAVKPVIATVEQRMIVKTLGRLSAADQGAVAALFRQALGL